MRTLRQCAAVVACLAAVPASQAVPLALGQPEATVGAQLSSLTTSGADTTQQPAQLVDDGGVAVAVIFVNRDVPRLAPVPRSKPPSPDDPEPVTVVTAPSVTGPFATPLPGGFGTTSAAGGFRGPSGGGSGRRGSAPTAGSAPGGLGGFPRGGPGGGAGSGPQADVSKPVVDQGSSPDAGGTPPAVAFRPPLLATPLMPDSPPGARIALAVNPAGSLLPPGGAIPVSNSVPTPSTLLLLGLGLAGLASARRVGRG